MKASERLLETIYWPDEYQLRLVLDYGRMKELEAWILTHEKLDERIELEKLKLKYNLT